MLKRHQPYSRFNPICNDNNRTRAKISFLIFAIICFVIGGLFFFEIPRENSALINMALGFVAGWASSVVGFYFGSSDNQTPEEARGTPADKLLEDKTKYLE